MKNYNTRVQYALQASKNVWFAMFIFVPYIFSHPGRSAARARPRPAPMRNPPQAVHQAPPPAPVQSGGGSMFGGFGSTIAQGMAFGTGSAVAHRAVDAVMGPRTIQHESVVSQASEATAAPVGNAASGMDSCNIHS